jgi:tRNA nucleotidyltransferase (CCA-adding enzyme)
MRRRIERLLRESSALKVADLAVNGDDVMRELEVAPGPAVREALEALLEEVLDDPSRNVREHLVARLRERRSATRGAVTAGEPRNARSGP